MTTAPSSSASRLLRLLAPALLCLLILAGVGGADTTLPAHIPVPQGDRFQGIGDTRDPFAVMGAFVGVPYRVLGAINQRGEFTNFEEQHLLYDTPGVNCSGLVLGAARFLLQDNMSIDDAIDDRQGNSQPDSPLGKEWDYGWDLIFNLTQGLPRRLIMPDAPAPLATPSTAPFDQALALFDGVTLRGFDLQDKDAWQTVLPMFRPGHLYLLSWSKPASKPGFTLLHYHVGVILASPDGGVHLYHATRVSGVHTMDLATPQGMDLFRREFRQSGDAVKMLLIVEAPLADRFQAPAN